MAIEIKSRWDSDRVVYRSETATSVREAVLEAVGRAANLSDSDLSGSNLSEIRADFWSVLDAAPAEVDALEKALRESRVDGTMYRGECACLVGTIANARGCDINELKSLTPDSDRPAERWFLAISPWLSAKHPVVAITLEWIDEWRKQRATPAEVAKEG